MRPPREWPRAPTFSPTRPDGKPDVILMGTGSELSLCVDAYEKLKSEGIKARVVSMPCWEIFEQQDAAYKESVLPANVTARVSVEMAATFGWDRYVGPKGRMIGMHRFGASAPLKDLSEVFRIHCRRGRSRSPRHASTANSFAGANKFRPQRPGFSRHPRSMEAMMQPTGVLETAKANPSSNF